MQLLHCGDGVMKHSHASQLRAQFDAAERRMSVPFRCRGPRPPATASAPTRLQIWRCLRCTATRAARLASCARCSCELAAVALAAEVEVEVEDASLKHALEAALVVVLPAEQEGGRGRE